MRGDQHNMTTAEGGLRGVCATGGTHHFALQVNLGVDACRRSPCEKCKNTMTCASTTKKSGASRTHCELVSSANPASVSGTGRELSHAGTVPLTKVLTAFTATSTCSIFARSCVW